MKIILSSVLALALTAFGARAQTSTTTPPAAPSSAGEDKGAAGMPNDQSSSALPGSTSNLPADKTGTVPAAPSDKAAPAMPNDSTVPAVPSHSAAAPADKSGEQGQGKHPKKLRRHDAPQGRSGSSDMHRARLPSDDASKSDEKPKIDADRQLPVSGDTAAPAAPAAPETTPGTALPTPEQQSTPAPEKGK